MANRIEKEVRARGFNEKELGDENKYWSFTLIYDPDLLAEWGKKCLETLEKVKNLPKEKHVRPHESDAVSVLSFQCIYYGWNYKGKNNDHASFVTTLYYYQLRDIFGLNEKLELDITHPTKDQELEVCKIIMEGLGEKYKGYVL